MRGSVVPVLLISGLSEIRIYFRNKKWRNAWTGEGGGGGG